MCRLRIGNYYTKVVGRDNKRRAFTWWNWSCYLQGLRDTFKRERAEVITRIVIRLSLARARASDIHQLQLL